MRVFITCLGLLSIFTFAACQSNASQPSSTVDTGETPSGGVVPGQTPQ